MSSRREHNPYPIRLVYDETNRRVRPVPYEDPLELFVHEIPLNAANDRGGYRVWVYDTLEEALAFVDAVEALLPGVEYVASAWPVQIGHQACGVVVVEVDWMGDMTIFCDRRRTWNWKSWTAR